MSTLFFSFHITGFPTRGMGIEVYMLNGQWVTISPQPEIMIMVGTSLSTDPFIPAELISPTGDKDCQGGCAEILHIPDVGRCDKRLATKRSRTHSSDPEE